jgi:outer membrane protein
MKKTGLLCAALVCGMIVTSAAYAADKLAYVDLSKIFSEYAKTKEYDKSLKDKEGVYTADRDKKVDEIKGFQDKLNLLSEKEKDAKKKELEDKIQSLREYDVKKQTELRKEQDAKMKEILKDIEDTVKKYAEEQGYTLVFNDRVLVYQTKSLDITDKIIERLNK